MIMRLGEQLNSGRPTECSARTMPGKPKLHKDIRSGHFRGVVAPASLKRRYALNRRADATIDISGALLPRPH